MLVPRFQLALTGWHELIEARLAASRKAEMAISGALGPYELFFFCFIFGAATLLILAKAGGFPTQERSGNSDALRKRLLNPQNRRQLALDDGRGSRIST